MEAASQKRARPSRLGPVVREGGGRPACAEAGAGVAVGNQNLSFERLRIGVAEGAHDSGANRDIEHVENRYLGRAMTWPTSGSTNRSNP